MHNEGIAKTASVVDAGVNEGVIEKSGNWLSFKGEKIGQGRDSAVKFLKEQPKIQDQIEKEVRSKLGLA